LSKSLSKRLFSS